MRPVARFSHAVRCKGLLASVQGGGNMLLPLHHGGGLLRTAMLEGVEGLGVLGAVVGAAELAVLGPDPLRWG